MPDNAAWADVDPFVLAKFEAAFRWLDADGDGAFTEADHVQMGRRAASALGHEPGGAAEQDMIDAYVNIWRRLHAPLDADGDGRLARDEFITACTALTRDADLARRTLGELADAVLAVADRDGSGTISLPEYTAFIHGHAPGLPDEQITAAFARLDLDGDGAIDHAELTRCVLDYYTGTDPDAPGNWMFGPPPA
ncbi:EF-hand domain-containing protein [Actinomadura rayongensis]|uniref:EF-hand domain-containing protein n=1 Tax=Actinomadura rayongensis TaxID=1429076 RepID=A0A6I4W0I3_9ACTN|nr:EF-hand domain-containing protein [Actinomadura rayongensis]MXQ62718.1 EF-hand domain-containing protein [Actinomadura rayongensis]